jgi:hypothetical protein
MTVRNTSRGKLKLPAHVLFRKDLSLMLWEPHGTLDEVFVNEIVAFIDIAEEKASKPFNRFADLSALDMVDLNFKFVFHIALHLRLASASHSPVKSAFYITSPAVAHYAKVHAMLTDYSPLDVALFTEREAAAKWLKVPVEVLMVQHASETKVMGDHRRQSKQSRLELEPRLTN